jgi:hypothetical protein
MYGLQFQKVDSFFMVNFVAIVNNQKQPNIIDGTKQKLRTWYSASVYYISQSTKPKTNQHKA